MRFALRGKEVDGSTKKKKSIDENERAYGKARVPVCTPHRLRHNAATRIRKDFGLEAAQLLLGHARADVTQLYAEADEAKAIDVVERCG